jgi:hypothetical protein
MLELTNRSTRIIDHCGYVSASGGNMRRVGRIVWIIGAMAAAFIGGSSVAKAASQDDRNSIVIVFKDGHQQSFPVADVARIEFTSPAATTAGSWPAHFVGKWKVGDGVGGSFFITLQRNGEANKTDGGPHGTWTVVDGEARITWDDGWRDAIRKAGNGYEKAAFEPGKTFSDSPSNVADAKKNAEPI